MFQRLLLDLHQRKRDHRIRPFPAVKENIRKVQLQGDLPLPLQLVQPLLLQSQISCSTAVVVVCDAAAPGAGLIRQRRTVRITKQRTEIQGIGNSYAGFVPLRLKGLLRYLQAVLHRQLPVVQPGALDPGGVLLRLDRGSVLLHQAAGDARFGHNTISRQ